MERYGSAVGALWARYGSATRARSAPHLCGVLGQFVLSDFGPMVEFAILGQIVLRDFAPVLEFGIFGQLVLGHFGPILEFTHFGAICI